MLMMTPQFAAGAGIVIAAMLAANVPHAALTYGPNPPVSRCARPCSTAGTTTPGKLTTSKPSVKFRPVRHKAHHRAARPARAAGSAGPAGHTGPADRTGPTAAASPGRSPVRIEYRTIGTSDSGFVAMIIINSPGKPDDWTLSFAFAAAQVRHVWGAQWQPDSTGKGGVATGQPWPWPGQKPGTARIVIFATGQSSAPASCSFDGAACSFS